MLELSVDWPFLHAVPTGKFPGRQQFSLGFIFVGQHFNLVLETMLGYIGNEANVRAEAACCFQSRCLAQPSVIGAEYVNISKSLNTFVE